MQSLAHRLRESAAARSRTLVAAHRTVWFWPGVALTLRRGNEIVGKSSETIRFWVTRLHGPLALHTEVVHGVEEAARRLTFGDEIAAQRALDAVKLARLSSDGGVLAYRIAKRFGIDPLDLPSRLGPRAWTSRDIDLHVSHFARAFDLNAPLVKAILFDSLKHPRWSAGAPESQGGRFKEGDDAEIIPVASRGSGGKGKPPAKSPSKPVPKETARGKSGPSDYSLQPGERPPITVHSRKLPPQPFGSLSGTGVEISPGAGEEQPKLEPLPELPPGMGHIGGPPLNDRPPPIPEEGLSTKAQNLFTKAAVRWIARALSVGELPELAAYWVALQIGEQVARVCWPYIKAYFQPPKTLEELQEDALHPEEGYNIHHHVEQGQARADGFPESVWDAPENRVRVPTLKHWLITGWYMTPNEQFGGLSPRAYLKGKTWEEKMAAGRKALILFGVLKP